VYAGGGNSSVSVKPSVAVRCTLDVFTPNFAAFGVSPRCECDRREAVEGVGERSPVPAGEKGTSGSGVEKSQTPSARRVAMRMAVPSLDAEAETEPNCARGANGVIFAAGWDDGNILEQCLP